MRVYTFDALLRLCAAAALQRNETTISVKLTSRHISHSHCSAYLQHSTRSNTEQASSLLKGWCETLMDPMKQSSLLICWLCCAQLFDVACGCTVMISVVQRRSLASRTNGASQDPLLHRTLRPTFIGPVQPRSPTGPVVLLLVSHFKSQHSASIWRIILGDEPSVCVGVCEAMCEAWAGKRVLGRPRCWFARSRGPSLATSSSEPSTLLLAEGERLNGIDGVAGAASKEEDAHLWSEQRLRGGGDLSNIARAGCLAPRSELLDGPARGSFDQW